MSAGDLPGPGPLEERLFRLCILLQAVFWAALLAMLGKALWAVATGGRLPDPVTLAAVTAALVALQLAAWFAWWRVRRARRQRHGRSGR